MTGARVEIDGSYGEGGGQILRTSLALAALTSRPLRITRIRAGRAKPGLAAQHLTAARAVAALCGGRLRGDDFGSQDLELLPGEVRGGSYEFDIAEERGSAGSVGLVLQALLPALLAAGEANVTIHGGTNVAWSPCFEYLACVFAPCLALLGPRLDLSRPRAGFYPHGGGTLTAHIAASRPLRPLRLQDPPVLRDLVLHSVVSDRLPAHIGPRQIKGARRALADAGHDLSLCRETDDRPPSGGPGTGILAAARLDTGFAGFSAVGERGRPAEKVGAVAGSELARFLSSRAHLDRYLSDQILLYAAFADGDSTWATTEVTEHLRTHAHVLRHFLPVEVSWREEEDTRLWRVTVTPA